MRDDVAFAQSDAVAVAERPAGLNRRQLLRAGAWAAPALVLATAAPAAAASTPTGVPVSMYTFSQNGITQVWSNQGNANVVTAFLGAVNFQPSGSVAVTAATLTLTMDKKGLVATKPIVVSGAGWVAGSATISGNSMVYTFVWAGKTLPYTNSPTLQYRLVADGQTKTSIATPKTVTGVLSGAQIKTTSNQVTWS